MVQDGFLLDHGLFRLELQAIFESKRFSLGSPHAMICKGGRNSADTPISIFFAMAHKFSQIAR